MTTAAETARTFTDAEIAAMTADEALSAMMSVTRLPTTFDAGESDERLALVRRLSVRAMAI